MSATEFASVQHYNIISLDLDLSGSPDLSGKNFGSHFSIQKPRLKNLFLKLVRIRDTHLDAIVTSCPKLQELALVQSESGSATISASAIKSMLETCSDLKRFRIDNDGGAKLASDLQDQLDMEQVQVELNGRAVVVEKLARISSLE